MPELSPTPDPHAEARARVEADVAAATQEAYETHATHVEQLENGTERLTLFVQAKNSVIAQVDVDRSPTDGQGNRSTIMKLRPIAQLTDNRGSTGRMVVGNGQVYENVWKLTESSTNPPRFETGQLRPDGAFVAFEDELMAHDETVASFGAYWPSNLRQGSPENPVRKSRGLGRLVGRIALTRPLPQVEYKNYYR